MRVALWVTRDAILESGSGGRQICHYARMLIDEVDEGRLGGLIEDTRSRHGR